LIFYDLESVLNSEFSLTLKDLIYKNNIRNKKYIFNKLKEFSSNFNEKYYFNKIIRYLIENDKYEEFFNFVRYYLEFPIITAEQVNKRIILDYHYISSDIPFPLLDITDDISVEFEFSQLELEEEELIVKGYAYIPFINIPSEENIVKKLVIKNNHKESEIILDNNEVSEGLSLGQGINYYRYAGFNKVIPLSNLPKKARVFLEIETNTGITRRNYAFDIENNKIVIDENIRFNEISSLAFKNEDPQLLDIEVVNNKLNLYIKCYNLLSKQLIKSLKYKPKLTFANKEIELNKIVHRDLKSKNVSVKRVLMLNFEIDMDQIEDEFKDYLLFTFAGSKSNIKTDQVQSEIKRVPLIEKSKLLKVYSNKKQNIEIHVTSIKKSEQSIIKKILKKIKRILKQIV
jgi:hypothetical protein